MVLLPIAFVPPASYNVVDVVRHAAFAGRLGQRVSEDLVVERDGARILVHVAGSYHTMAVREGARLHVGDTVTIRGDVRDGATVARDGIRKVKA